MESIKRVENQSQHKDQSISSIMKQIKTGSSEKEKNLIILVKESNNKHIPVIGKATKREEESPF